MRTSTALPQVSSSAAWADYFRDNLERPREVPWELGADAPDDVLAKVLPSLRGWQLGETSDGSHLLKAAAHYARSTGDAEFIRAARLFIREEQLHDEQLGRFLDLTGTPRASFDLGDFLFRSVRYLLPRMVVWATPVLMVETHAMIYYNALRIATPSRTLRAICRGILTDEVPHIRFQCERLAILHRDRSRPLLAITHVLQLTLFAAITLAVWIGHRRVLTAVGYSFGHFWRTAWARMRRGWRMVAPHHYAWPSQPAAETVSA